MNSLQIKYTDMDMGWINLTFSYNDVSLNYSFSGMETSPEEMIKWAEKVFAGQFSRFECSCENYNWYLDYDGTELIISDDLNEDNQKIKIEISKAQLCKEIYSSFRQFVSSGEYFRFWWDGMTFEEYLTDRFGSIENALSIGAKSSLEKFCQECKKNLPNPELAVGFELFAEFESFESKQYSTIFDSLSDNEKKQMIQEHFSDFACYDKSCKNLKEVKSDVLEMLIS